MDQTIDPKIRPLVDALNGIHGVRTIASCEGHCFRISRPYVYFHCPPALAEGIAARLHDLFMADAQLHRWWHLTGCFHPEHGLCFTLEAPALDHDRGLLKTFLNYIIFRKKIDADLSVLADEFLDLSQDGHSFRQVLPQHVPANKEAGNEQNLGQHGLSAKRIFSLAKPTHLRVRSKWLLTNSAFNQLRHIDFPYMGIWAGAWNLACRFSVVAILAVTLTACGTGKVELQQNGSGMDELLPSPCVCNQVPYDTDFYRWGRA